MISPYKRIPVPPFIGVIMESGSVLLEDGGLCKPGSPKLKGHKLYVAGEIAMHHVLRGKGSVLRWNDAPYRWEHEGQKIDLLSSVPPSPEEMLEGLVAWRDWAASYGAAVGNFRQATRSLLRATIEKPFVLEGGSPPPIDDIIGGRQSPFRVPGHYGAVQMWDIEAAYASAVGEMRYGGRWYEIPDAPLDDSVLPTICHARVKLPSSGIGLLPRRRRGAGAPGIFRRLAVREYPTGARMQGLWSWRELQAARDAGASVEIDRSWIMPGERRPFYPWYQAILEGRKLPGFAGSLVKRTGNALWGSLASEGVRTRLSFVDGMRTEAREPIAGKMPQARGTAEVICASVRARLLTEMILPNASRLISVHTDGAIVEGSQELCNPGPGWRLKDTGDRLTYIGPQAFSYGQGDITHFKVSGVPESEVAEVFAGICALVLDYPVKTTTADVDAFRRLKAEFPGITIIPNDRESAQWAVRT